MKIKTTKKKQNNILLFIVLILSSICLCDFKKISKLCLAENANSIKTWVLILQACYGTAQTNNLFQLQDSENVYDFSLNLGTSSGTASFGFSANFVDAQSNLIQLAAFSNGLVYGTPLTYADPTNQYKLQVTATSSTNATSTYVSYTVITTGMLNNIQNLAFTYDLNCVLSSTFQNAIQLQPQ